MKACECGCGAAIAARDRGYKKRRFVNGHNRGMKGKRRAWLPSILERGYVKIVTPGHPRATKRNHYVFEHILVAEKALGRYLELRHPVHHHNELKADNANINLVICESQSYHLLLHARAKVVRRGGDPERQAYCHSCDELKPFGSFGIKSDRVSGRRSQCKACERAYDLRFRNERQDRERAEAAANR